MPHGLSESLINYEERNLLKGVSIASDYPSISHLFFAEDKLIFCRAKSNECAQLWHCLTCYSRASGQSINFEKSALSFSPNTYLIVHNDICAMFGISDVEGHEIYLGLPTFSLRNKRIQFGYIRDWVVKKL